MAHKKQGGKIRQQSQRAGKRLGVKISGGQKVGVGSILVRQRGTKFHPSDGVGLGRDHTIFATKAGKVVFKKKQGKSMVGVQAG